MPAFSWRELDPRKDEQPYLSSYGSRESWQLRSLEILLISKRSIHDLCFSYRADVEWLACQSVYLEPLSSCLCLAEPSTEMTATSSCECLTQTGAGSLESFALASKTSIGMIGHTGLVLEHTSVGPSCDLAESSSWCPDCCDINPRSLFLAGIAAASGDSLIILLNNHARLAFAGKTITNQDHLEYL